VGGQIEDMEGLLAFPVLSPEGPGLEIRVNFGMFAGREATAAEMQELGTALLTAIDNADLSAETHFEIGPDTEADVHQVRIGVPAESLPADDFLVGELAGRLIEIAERWARDCFAARHAEVSEL
jgi:hypothetical protein